MQPHYFDQLVRTSFKASGLVLGGGARILSGPDVPVDGVTGKGRAGRGSLYIRLVDDPELYENVGTKQVPDWYTLVGGLQ